VILQGQSIIILQQQAARISIVIIQSNKTMHYDNFGDKVTHKFSSKYLNVFRDKSSQNLEV
jgi:hypothetical protein